MSNKIHTVIIDVDGTLTDGLYTISSKGSIQKSFHTRDMHALHCLQRSGVTIVIITGASDNVINVKVEQMNGFKCCLKTGVDDKLEVINDLGIDCSCSLYIGDGDNDIFAMQHVIQEQGYVACPNDAIDEVANLATYIADRDAGRGAVDEIIREFSKKERFLIKEKLCLS